MKTRRYLDTLFLLSIGVLLGFSVLSAILHAGGFAQSQMRSLAQMFVVIGILRILLSNKYLIGLSVTLLVLGLSGLALGFLTAPDEPRLIHEAADFVTAVVQYAFGYGYHNALYEQTFAWILCGLIGLFVVWFFHIHTSFFVIFAVFASIFGTLIVLDLIPYFFPFYLFIFCILAFLIKQLSLTQAEQTGRSGSFLRLALPLALLCAGLAVLIPTPQEDAPYHTPQISFIDSLRRVGDEIFFGTDTHYFGIQQAGFGGSDSRRLGGDVVLSDELFMRIRTNAPQPIYLTGVTMDTYTGYGWENRLTEQTPLYFDELLPNLALYEYFTTWIYHTSRTDVATVVTGLAGTIRSFGTDFDIRFDIDPFHQERSILIGGIDRRLHTVFHTGLVQGFESHNTELNLMQEQSGQLLTRELIPRNVWYTLTYIPLDESVQDIHMGVLSNDSQWENVQSHYELRKRLRNISYRGILQEFLARFEATPSSGFILTHHGREIDFYLILQNYLIPRADWIHETYTTLPDEFPPRIREHALRITEGAVDNYYRADLLASYLRTEFTYTLTPGMPPSDRDFVDYFLFDSRVGYCTYFASAFVTMARSLGIPARYVEGFLVNGTPDEDGFIHVLNSMGHAWAEVYLEGYGWLRFDPTPPASTPDIPPADEPDTQEEPPEYPPIEIPDDQPALEVVAHPPMDESQPSPAAEETLQIPPWVLPASAIALLVLLLAIRVIWVRVREAQIRKYDNREAVCYYFSVLRSNLKLLGLEMRQTETASQFYHRAAKSLGSFSGLLFPQELVEIYTKARYGNEHISLEERKHMEHMVHRVTKVTKEHVGKLRYLRYKYLSL